MSELSDKLKTFEQAFIRWQFRFNRRARFRIYRKLEGMLKNNEALSRALDRLYQNVTEMGKYPNRPAAVALREWFLKDRAGLPLSQAIEGWIPSAEVYMVRAGEESGTLAKALASIQTMGERSKEMKQAVSYAVGYPVFMAVLVSFVIWTFGVNLIANMRNNAPKNVVEAMGGVAAFSDFVTAWGLYLALVVVIICLAIAFTMPYWCGPTRSKFDLYPPWSWYRVLNGSGFLLGLSSLLGAQVPLKRSLEILEEQGSPWMKERIGLARQKVLRGHNLGEALRLTKMNFPDPMVAIDLEILAERADVGAVIEQVTDEWMTEQIEAMKMQAVVIRNLGMAMVGGVIGWTMMSIFGVVGELAKPSGGNGY